MSIYSVNILSVCLSVVLQKALLLMDVVILVLLINISRTRRERVSQVCRDYNVSLSTNESAIVDLINLNTKKDKGRRNYIIKNYSSIVFGLSVSCFETWYQAFFLEKLVLFMRRAQNLRCSNQRTGPTSPLYNLTYHNTFEGGRGMGLS